MSDITKERWARFNNEVVSGQGETVTVDAGTSSREDEVLAAIAVLPEALALLDEWEQRERGDPTLALKEKTRNILRRAGVLE